MQYDCHSTMTKNMFVTKLELDTLNIPQKLNLNRQTNILYKYKT